MTFKIRAMLEGAAKHSDPEKAKEALSNYLKELVNVMNQRESITVLADKLEKPKLTGDNIFTNFVEVTVEIKNFSGMLGFIIDFGPINIEILEPEGVVKIDSGELEGVTNDFIAKIHEYDKRLKAITAAFLKLQKTTQNKK
ncbi:MAG: hypothetical protein GON13_01705 [Nanoarchaeota archaeon]|nr:hypothetical protein [Nanoarchaeota archaeon]